jgi:uncharacterized protein YjbI with pentapeptide repeats
VSCGYAKAVEQLASDNPTIRLGGVYVLSALANDWLAIQDYRQRQVCVDILCAYLRSNPEIPGQGTENILDARFLAILKKDQDVRKAALETLSEIRALDLEGADETTSGLAQSFQDLYRTLTKAVSGPIPPVRIELRGITLRSLDLRHARLAYLPLVSADLRGAHLDGADLTKTDLTQAKMHDIVLRDAKLNRTNLSGAELERVDLTGALLIKANLNHTTITAPEGLRGNLGHAVLIGLHISHAWGIKARGSAVVMDKETLEGAAPYIFAGHSENAPPITRPLMEDEALHAHVSNRIRARRLAVDSPSEGFVIARDPRIEQSWPGRPTERQPRP